MSLTINLPPAMETEARGYRMLEGTTLEQMFLDCLEKEFERRRAEQQSRAKGKPAKIRNLELDPRLRGSIDDADLFSDDAGLWNACHDEIALA